ncbi:MULTISPECIES: AI-2E family transporter [Enterococcus]|uniref:AI-2E family transporter n=1 Tax=Enterococcus diestrammenae TaxID=1155073 RepID=A0ABV0F5K1_9ENTE|nr:AI-2E family transporter [Enterococcus diestrammenae]KAF1298923.1 AI-2E family transporter [Enterococcus diestrammenae]
MFEKLKNSKLLFWSVELLVVATLILVSTKIGFIFQPVVTFFTTLFAPVLIAGFLYYLLNPVVNLLTKLTKMKRILAIAIVLLLLLGIIIWTILAVIPSLVNQLTSLAESMPSFVKAVRNWALDLAKNPIFNDVDIEKQIDKLNISYGGLIQQFINGLSTSLGSIVGGIASTAMLVVTVPFILFYMLKDGHRLVPNVQRFFPENRRTQIVELLAEMNKTLSNYISGQAIECIFVATGTFIGYLLIGLDYAFLFGMLAGVTNLIPYLGPYLGLLPAVAVSIFHSPVQALLCCVVVLVVQQIDGNIIYPNVIGKSLQIHPLTIILILLVAGNIAGLLGIFLGVPFYAICRTIVIFLARIVRDDKSKQKQSLLTDKNS